MNNIAAWFRAMVIGVSSVICPQNSSAETFKGADFLSWTEAQQRSYIEAQLVMASTIVTRAKPEMSQCLADEFFSANGVTGEGFARLLKTIESYSEFHPSSVLVIAIENECGNFY